MWRLCQNSWCNAITLNEKKHRTKIKIINKIDIVFQSVIHCTECDVYVWISDAMELRQIKKNTGVWKVLNQTAVLTVF